VNTPVIGVGTDLVHIPETRDMLATSGPAFPDMCWTLAEQQLCAGSASRLAARWAAKEAAMKSIGHGIGDVDPLDIEVLSGDGGQPSLSVTGDALRLAARIGVTSFLLSMSHETDYALAVVVALSTSTDRPEMSQIVLTTALRDGLGDVCSQLRVGAGSLPPVLDSNPIKGRSLAPMTQDDEQVEVGQRLKSARTTLGLTQEDVASVLGIQRTSVIALEAGRRNVTALELRRLARLYRRDVAWILGEVDQELSATEPENQALFRATAQLSPSDKEQVLRFAEFLAAGDSSAGEGRAPGDRRPRRPAPRGRAVDQEK
jgi:phosphopantetheine--protein transferase-like protein